MPQELLDVMQFVITFAKIHAHYRPLPAPLQLS